MLTEKQYEYCKQQANRVAKILMDQDVSAIFGDAENANFVMETCVILISGIIALFSEQIHWDKNEVLKAFAGEVNACMNQKNNPKLSLVN